MPPHPTPQIPAALRLPNMPSGRERLTFDRPRIMGVLNVTPDSFSDGGRFDSVASAVEAGLAMSAAGADVLDVGGESTRPGSQRVAAAEQSRRVVPVIERLREALNDSAPHVTISVDTTRAEVGRAALDAGASILNDVSAGREDEGMFALAAEARAPLILMHMLGQPATMQADPRYDDVVAEVSSFLDERTAEAISAGVERSQIVIDPGIGFGKTLEHNLALLRAIPRFVESGQPVLIGASRKRFIGMIEEFHGVAVSDASQRLGGTVAATVWSVTQGAAMIRVHDVQENTQAARLVGEILGTTPR